MRFRVATTYHDIKRPNLLSFAEGVFMDDALLSVSLVAVQLTGNESTTQLDLNIQVTSLVGERMIAGNWGGWTSALTNLGKYVAG